MTLSVVIPAYNEEDNIEGVILDITSEFPKAEIVVIDDASTDKTLDILLRLAKKNKNLRVFTNGKNRGHGETVIRGLREAKGDYILYIDADRQIDLNNFPKFSIAFIDLDFISGYRVHRQDKLFRKIVSFCLRMTNLIKHGYYIKDANCPFKVYKRTSLMPLIEDVPKSYIIPIACLEVIARKSNLKTMDIPVLHHKYHSERKGFLQAINKKTLKFFWDAFKETTSL